MQESLRSRQFAPYSRYGNNVDLNANCLFCKIISGDLPADIVFRNENVVAFNDIDPQAPTHVLIVPTVHVETAGDLARISPTITAAILTAAVEIAAERGVTGYRTVFNTGVEAGQSVFHAHLHLLGGRALAWPPG